MVGLLGAPRYAGSATMAAPGQALASRTARKKKRGSKKSSSSVPGKPPSSMYDPALDATLRAAGRGYTDLQQDTELGATRRAADYGIATGEIRRQFDSLGRQQLGSAAGAGLLNSGWRGQSYKIRSDNMARAIAPLTLANTRSATDSATTLQRAGRELGFFGSDTNASRIYQARAAGWDPKTGKRKKGAFG